MFQIATITSKRQLTIPVSTFRRLGFEEGQKVLVTEIDGAMQIKPVINLVESLAGSVDVPKRFKDLTPDKMIKRTKKEYFSKK